MSPRVFWKEDWIDWSVAVCSGKIAEGSQIWFQKERSLEVFRSRIETAVPRPPPLAPFHRLFFSLDFGLSRLFSAFLGHLRAHFNINIFWSRVMRSLFCRAGSVTEEVVLGSGLVDGGRWSQDYCIGCIEPRCIIVFQYPNSWAYSCNIYPHRQPYNQYS